MKYKLILLKRSIEDFFIYPFVLLGRLASGRFHKEYEIIFLFPFYHIGGAERVHLEVARSFKDKRGLIVFTKKSTGTDYLEDFKGIGLDVWEVSQHTDDKLRYWKNLFYRGVLSGKISKLEKDVIIFNGQCNFAYKLSRWLPKSIRQIELIHSYCSFSQIRLPFLSYYTTTCMISKRKIEDHLGQYERLGVPAECAKRIAYTPNAIRLPNETGLPKNITLPVELFLVGRNSPEKRVPWAIQLTKCLRELGLEVQLRLVGDFSQDIPNVCKDFVFCFGPVSDWSDLQSLYESYGHFILITSSDEASPLVLMEGASHGMLVISTDVGDNALHVRDGENGLIFPVSMTLEEASKKIFRFVMDCIRDPIMFCRYSQENIGYARAHFGLTSFSERYRKVVLGEGEGVSVASMSVLSPENGRQN